MPTLPPLNRDCLIYKTFFVSPRIRITRGGGGFEGRKNTIEKEINNVVTTIGRDEKFFYKERRKLTYTCVVGFPFVRLLRFLRSNSICVDRLFPFSSPPSFTGVSRVCVFHLFFNITKNEISNFKDLSNLLPFQIKLMDNFGGFLQPLDFESAIKDSPTFRFVLLLFI